MNLLRTIIQSRWALDMGAASALVPFLDSLIKGDASFFSKDQNKIQSYVVRTERQVAGGGTVTEGVGVIPIQGVMTKYAECALSMQDMERMIKNYSSDPSIVAIVFDIDTPGGEASYLPNMARTMSEVKKPMISFYSGSCCSAGYYIASQTNEIYSSTKLDSVGSIGTMISFRKPHPDNAQHVDVILNARTSPDKNKPYLDALKGEYDLIYDSLDEFHAEFIDAVKSKRPDISPDALTGKVFNTTQAIKMKMIDGQLNSLNEAIDRAFQLGTEQKSNSNNSNTSQEMKKLEKISGILGRDVFEGEQLSAEDLLKIDAHQDSTAETTETTNEVVDEVVETTASTSTTEPTPNPVLESLEQFKTQMQQMQTTMNSFAERLNVVEGLPAAGAAETTPTNGQIEDYSDMPWADPNNSVNKAAENALKPKINKTMKKFILSFCLAVVLIAGLIVNPIATTLATAGFVAIISTPKFGVLSIGLDISEVTTQLGAYFRKFSNAIWVEILKGVDFEQYMKKIPGQTSQYITTTSRKTEMLQRYQKAWTPKGGIELIPYINQVFKLKMDYVLDNLDELYPTYLAFLVDEKKEPAQYPFVQWLVTYQIIPGLIEELRAASVKGDAVAVTAGTATSSIGALNGIFTIITDEIALGNITPIATGAITSVNVVDKIEAWHRALPSHIRNMKGNIFCASDMVENYKFAYRDAFGSNQDFEGPTVKLWGTKKQLVGLDDLNGSSRLMFTPDGPTGNLLCMYNEVMMPTIRTQQEKRDVLLLADFHRGYGFETLDAVYVNDQA